MSEADTLTNAAFPEAVNSVNSTEAAQANRSDSDSPDEKRSRLRKLMLTQQTQEIATAQEQLRSLFQEVEAAQEQLGCLLHELEASHQTAQRQQILIESLTARLESSQERVAQMERECFLAQQRYNEQSHQLVQTENACRELHSRLARQQGLTLQFKVALEKCLEAPVPSHEFQNAPYSCAPLLPKVQPIQPWSAQPESLNNELEPVWDSPLYPTHSRTWGESSAVDWSAGIAGEPIPAVETDDLNGDRAAEEATLVASFNQQPSEAVSPLRQTEEEQSDDVMQHCLDSLDQTPQFQRTSSPQQETSCFTPKSNWPSPVVYPSRPPKGRKSLAAIELPTFRPHPHT